MILVDTSVWVDHIRRVNADLVNLLARGLVTTHPFVVGELVCGNLPRRAEFIHMLSELPHAEQAAHDEVLALVESHRLMGLGISWFDVHLIAAAMLSRTAIWSLDVRLATAARRLGLATTP